MACALGKQRFLNAIEGSKRRRDFVEGVQYWRRLSIFSLHVF